MPPDNPLLRSLMLALDLSASSCHLSVWVISHIIVTPTHEPTEKRTKKKYMHKEKKGTAN